MKGGESVWKNEMTRLTIETFAQSLLCVVVRVVVASKCAAYNTILYSMANAAGIHACLFKMDHFSVQFQIGKASVLVAAAAFATATPSMLKFTDK